MWQLGTFNMDVPSLTSIGFAKIKPQLAGTTMSSDGVFDGIFTNGVGTQINVSLSEVTITSEDGIVCKPEGSNVNPYAGENFNINAIKCKKGSIGNEYTASVSIPYKVAIGSITTSHTETGVIRGPFE